MPFSSLSVLSMSVPGTTRLVLRLGGRQCLQSPDQPRPTPLESVLCLWLLTFYPKVE